MQAVVSRSALALGVALSLPLSARVAEPAAQPQVVVTAHRAPVTVDETLASVSVITREDIQASGSHDLVDLLRTVPGVDLARSGGQGGQTSVFLRGTNSNHVLVLVDGVRISALGTGAYAWEEMDLAQVERIEIVRGPRAALWGSDAIGGVIQIFTRRADGFDATARAGNHGTLGADAGAGWRGERGGFDLRLGWDDARGINAQNPDGFAFDPDDDGYTRRHALAHGDVALGEQVLSGMASLRDNDVEFDQGESSTRQSQAMLALDGALADGWEQHVQLASMRDTLRTPDFFSRFESRREQADWHQRLALAARGELLFGLGYVRERGVNLDTFAGEPVFAARRHNRAAFASWRGGVAAHDFELSGRRDDNSQFGGESTFQAAWGWHAGEALRTTLSWGEGFRAPTLNELYSPGFGGLFAGNPALDPEHSRSVEAGLDWQANAALRFGLAAYRTDVRDLVSFSGGDTFQAVNIARVRIDGIELSGVAQWDAWSLSGNATWQDARNRDTDAPLLRRADRKASALLERSFDGGARLGLEGQAVSDRPEFGGDLPGYGLLSLRGSLPLGETLALDGRVENLFDRDYTLVRGFNTPGMTLLLSLRWTP
jgi:vitamin B12 transporter